MISQKYMKFILQYLFYKILKYRQQKLFFYFVLSWFFITQELMILPLIYSKIILFIFNTFYLLSFIKIYVPFLIYPFYHFYQFYILQVYFQLFSLQQAVVSSSFLLMFTAYTRLLNQYPLLTKMITSGVLLSFGDAITQKVIDKKPKLDLKRNLNLFLVGTTYVGPLLHLWYCKLLPKIGSFFFKQTTKKSTRVFTLMSADQLIFTPFYLIGFFIYDGIMNKFSMKGLRNGFKNCRQKIWETLIINWMIWPIAMTVNFWFVPVLYQVPYVMLFEFFWNIILSYICYDQTPNHKILHNKK